MKQRSFFYALAAGVLVLLLIGAGGFYWLKSPSPLAMMSGGQMTPSAAMFVPKQAPVMVSLLVNPDRLEEGFRQAVDRSGNRGRSRVELDQVKQSLLANTDLDYQKDIQPWLGDEITFSVTSLDFDRTSQNGEQRGLLLIATSKNPQRSNEFVDLFWQKQSSEGAALEFEQYKGVKLIYTQGKEKSVASAVVGDRFVLFANNPKVLRTAINNVQAPDLSLSEDPAYQKALENIPGSKIGLTYVNLPRLAKLLGNKSESSITQKYETLAIALEINRQGLLAQTALQGTAGSEATMAPTVSQAVGALQYLPEQIAIAAAGTHLDKLRELSSTQKSDDTLSQLINQPLADLQTRWGIDVEQDIFSWVQGEYALGILPRSDRNPDWIFVAESAENTAEAAINHLDDVAKQQGLSVSSFTLENHPIFAWTKLTTVPPSKESKEQNSVRLEAKVQGVRATIGKYEIFTTSIEAMDQALKAPENSLLKSDNFQTNIASLPQPNNGYLYLDWASSQSILERQLPIVRVVELFAKPLFNQLNSLTFSSYGTDAGVQRSKVFFRLGSDAKG